MVPITVKADHRLLECRMPITYDPEPVELLRTVLDQAWAELQACHKEQISKSHMAGDVLRHAAVANAIQVGSDLEQLPTQCRNSLQLNPRLAIRRFKTSSICWVRNLSIRGGLKLRSAAVSPIAAIEAAIATEAAIEGENQ
jgi:hypothetical protein